MDRKKIIVLVIVLLVVSSIVFLLVKKDDTKTAEKGDNNVVANNNQQDNKPKEEEIKLSKEKLIPKGSALVNGYELEDVITYDWPTAEGQAILSDKYAVSLTQNGKTIMTEVIMSKSKDIEINDWASEFKGRTLSYASFSSDFSSPITVSVQKIYGETVESVEIVPSPYKIAPTISEDKRTITFTLDKPDYVSVNFKSKDNAQTSDGVVKNMLMIFADPKETDAPKKTDEGVVVYSKDTTIEEMKNAKVIYFPKGYHNLSAQFASKVGNMAETVSTNKEIYFEGGAFVHGRLYGANASNVKIYGRGVLTGRDFKWYANLSLNGGIKGVDTFSQMESHIGISGAGNIIEGIIVCDGAGHGVNLGDNATYTRTKYWGWHCNNDGFRPWGNKINTIDHCFIRSCDDALYNKSLLVTDTIFWPGFNGSILCLGWDGKYNTENSVFKNNYVIYPEWRNIGNNNGIVMSQVDYDMSGLNVLIDGLFIDGNIPALLNLHTSSSKAGSNDYKLGTDFTNKVGTVSGITLKNIVVTGEQVIFDGYSYEQTKKKNKSLIQGAALLDGSKYMMSDITIDNVTIGGVLLTEDNKDEYFKIDKNTTEGIKIIKSEN